MKYAFIMLLAIASACGSKTAAEDDDVEWKEMDEFHAIMADVYHPLKEANDLGPIKSGADNLAAAATKWAQAKIPAKVDNDKTKEALAQLEDGCQKLSKNISIATDEEITVQLTTLHDIFHSIMEEWHKSGKEEHEH